MNSAQLLGGIQTQFAPNQIAHAAPAPRFGSWGTRWFPEQEQSRARAQMVADRRRDPVGLAANVYSGMNPTVAANVYFDGTNANLFANLYFGTVNLGPDVDLDANVGVGTNLNVATNLDLGANVISPLLFTQEDQRSVLRAAHHGISGVQRPDVVSRLAVIRDLIQNDRVLQARRLLAVIPI